MVAHFLDQAVLRGLFTSLGVVDVAGTLRFVIDSTAAMASATRPLQVGIAPRGKHRLPVTSLRWGSSLLHRL